MLTLTQRDTEILQMLALHVRVASLSQIARVWWSGGTSENTPCSHRLRRLELAGLLARKNITALAPPALNAPLACWQFGLPMPNLGELAWTLKCRWRAEPVSQTIFLATRKCARLFGGKRSGSISRPFQISHDLGTTEMYLALRRLNPVMTMRWIGEDRLAAIRRHQKIPDAVIACDLQDIPELVLEFGGNYPKSRLEAFHEDNEMRGLSYQIW